MKYILICSLVFLGIWAQAGEKITTTGEVFDLEGKEKLFDFIRYRSEQGNSVLLRNEFRDLSGETVVEETAQLIGGQIKYYTINQKQTNQKGRIEVKGQKVHFTLDELGKKETDDESLPSNLVIGMTLVPHLQSNWQKLMTGASLKTRFAVWDRKETVGFKFWKIKDFKENDKDMTVITMKPTSFIIRALVDPLEFTFEKDSKKLITLKGRTSPKIKKGAEWKPLDAFIKYSSKN